MRPSSRPVACLAVLAAASMLLPVVMAAVAETEPPRSPRYCLYRWYWVLYSGWCFEQDWPSAVAQTLEQNLQNTEWETTFTADAILTDRETTTINPLTDLWYAGDEPNVYTSGQSHDGTPYDHDLANGIADAMDRWKPPHVILNVKYGFDCRPFAVWCSKEIADRLLEDTGISPGEPAFIVLYGRWKDLNEDGWIQYCPPGQPHPKVWSRDGAGVNGDDLSLGVVQIGDACQEAEWMPIQTWRGGPEPRLVGYVSPGDWSTSGSPRSPREPDLFFQPLGHGVYYAPGKLLPSSMSLTGSALTTIAVEAYEGELDTLASRTYRPVDGTPTDTDLMGSLDPAVEDLYFSRTNWIGETAQDALNKALDALPSSMSPEAFERYTGPVVKPVTEPYPAETGSPYSATGWKPYLDARLTETVAVRGPGGTRAEQTLGPSTPLIGGPSKTAPGEVKVSGYLGIWYDKNGDGWIGAPEPSEGCSDVHDCGNTPDPNEYGSRDEFLPFCPTTTFLATLYAENDVWPGGAYIVNETDDALADLADGRVDQLRTSGPIELTMLCDPATGVLRSAERILLPKGTLDNAVGLATDFVQVEFRNNGYWDRESVRDEDWYPAWSIRAV